MRKKELNELRLEREMKFIQIPGPNPILVGSGEGAWDERNLESCDVLKDGDTYYLYYHAQPKDSSRWPHLGYRIGVATAPHPLGPWMKYEGNPIIDSGPEDSWDGVDRTWVAGAALLKEEADKYYLWYNSSPSLPSGAHIGLACASHPLGPWEKYEGNPVVEDFGYIGGVVKVGGKYYMYNAYPVGATSPDQGPICLATAEKPSGPWNKYEGNPVIPAGEWGAWDDGGYSEAGFLYHDGVFHVFYGGTKWSKLESIGYAYSLDGYNFIKYSGNPVAPRENNPDASGFAEVHALFQPPFYYVYHTLRYISKGGEDLGVQILATETPFRLAMPVLSIDSLAAGKSSELTVCPPISLERISDASLTVECSYHADAEAGIKLHLKASFDGINYDTEDLYAFDIPFAPGKRVSKTVKLDAKVMFIKVIVENLDKEHDITNVKVTATLGNS